MVAAGLGSDRVAATQPPAAQPDPGAKDAEPLPPFPKLDPANTVAPLNPNNTLFAEVAEDGAGKKVVRVALVTEVCLREGRSRCSCARRGRRSTRRSCGWTRTPKLSTLLLAAGAKAGTPTQFIDPKTEQAEVHAGDRDEGERSVHYRKDGKLHTHPAQEWMWDTKKKAPMSHGWVFAGSTSSRDPDDPKPAVLRGQQRRHHQHLELPVLDAGNAGRDHQGRRQPDLRGEDGQDPAAVCRRCG